MFDITDILPC